MSTTFFVLAADAIGKLLVSLGGRTLGDKLKGVMNERRMARLVQDAVDRIVEQMDQYLNNERLGEDRKGILLDAICAKLEPLVDDPQRFFAGNLDGAIIFKQCHPAGQLPQEIREERLEQFYSVLFPQVAHMLAGSRIALEVWAAEGFREEFKRLTQIAMEIRAVGERVAEFPGAVVDALESRESQAEETLLRELAQTALNSLLVKLDLSPLRAERALHGSLTDHYVVPAVQERRHGAKAIGEIDEGLVKALTAPEARRVLHGGAGVGKTTCALWLQLNLLQASPSRLAVVIRLREASDLESRSLLELLRERASIHLRDGITNEVLKKWHQAGRLILIFDGFDEIAEQRRDRVEAWLRDLATVAQKTAMLVMSRPLQTKHLEGLGPPWQQWDLLPFDEARIIDFIDRWHRYLPEHELSTQDRHVDATGLARTFSNDPSLKPLSDTPLMLATLLFVHHRDKKLPSGRVDLYERYIGAMLGLRDSGLGIQARGTRLTDREKRRVLSHMALHFHINSVNEVNDDVAKGLVVEALTKLRLDEEPERLLAALTERTGLLQGPGAWSFMHKTIGEFLVAELVCEGTTVLTDGRRLDRKELWAHRHEDSWTAVLFFWAGKASTRELEEFILELVAEGKSEAAMLALSLLFDQGERLPLETQRTATLRILDVPWDKSHLPPIQAAAAPFCVPTVAWIEYTSDDKVLRSLSSVDYVSALAAMLGSGALVPSDLTACPVARKYTLTLAMIWAARKYDSRITLDCIDHHLVHLPRHDLAILLFPRVMRAVNYGDEGEVARLLAEWLRAFPDARLLTPFLWMGVLVGLEDWTNSHRVKMRVCRMLWEWRNEPIDEGWLIVSDNCMTDTWDGDILKELKDTLVFNTPTDCGLTAAEHEDLLRYHASLLARRTELKAAAAQMPTPPQSEPA
jgi:hypothetical protein